MKKPRDDNWFNCVCPICGKRFHLKEYAVKNRKTKPCCSKACLREYKRILMTGEGNHQYGLKGSKNASWKSDRKKTSYGYIQIRVLDHPFKRHGDYVFEHRLVAEQYLLTKENSVEINGKYYLSPEYEVHHINFCRADNRPENLVVMKKGDHIRLHTALNPQKRDKKTGRFEKSGPIKIKKVTSTAIKPERKTSGAAGYDLCVDSDEKVTIPPHSVKMLSTGLAFSIPDGYAGFIYARSGTATKKRLHPATCVSVIDSDYRGNVMLPTVNDSDEPKEIQPHERIAQLVIQKVYTPELELVEELEDTERGSEGFGSTGR